MFVVQNDVELERNREYGRECKLSERKQRLWSLCTAVERSKIMKLVSRLVTCMAERICDLAIENSGFEISSCAKPWLFPTEFINAEMLY